jgi:hypothetical protein
MWGLSRQTICRIFEDEPGVMKYGRAETRFKRKYCSLIIPQSVVMRVHQRLTK